MQTPRWNPRAALVAVFKTFWGRPATAETRLSLAITASAALRDHLRHFGLVLQGEVQVHAYETEGLRSHALCYLTSKEDADLMRQRGDRMVGFCHDGAEPCACSDARAEGWVWEAPCAVDGAED